MSSSTSMITPRLARMLTTLVAALLFPMAVGAQAHDHHPVAGAKTSTTPKTQEPAKVAKAEDHMVGMADHAMASMGKDSIMSLHMEMSPVRTATPADSARAMAVAADLRRAIAKYQDTAVAVSDGYRMFLPNVKNQPIYHFTNGRKAFREAFRFDPEQPTSLLYKRGDDGKLILIGAMYTAPKRMSLDKLDERIPLSVARWHKHVNWCLPERGQNARWFEQQDGLPKFGPQSPIASKSACDAVGGKFHENVFGWMIHANVYAGNDLGSVYGDDHGHDHGHAR
jgi:hypothetical protein